MKQRTQNYPGVGASLRENLICEDPTRAAGNGTDPRAGDTYLLKPALPSASTVLPVPICKRYLVLF